MCLPDSQAHPQDFYIAEGSCVVIIVVLQTPALGQRRRKRICSRFPVCQGWHKMKRAIVGHNHVQISWLFDLGRDFPLPWKFSTTSEHLYLLYLHYLIDFSVSNFTLVSVIKSSASRQPRPRSSSTAPRTRGPGQRRSGLHGLWVVWARGGLEGAADTCRTMDDSRDTMQGTTEHAPVPDWLRACHIYNEYVCEAAMVPKVRLRRPRPTRCPIACTNRPAVGVS